jgi:hypothetical protein
MTVEDVAARMYWCERKARERVRIWHERQHDAAVPRVTKPPCARRGRRRYAIDAASFEAWRAAYLAPYMLDLAA